jgi:uncharacterized protein (TIGR03083 family)
MDSDRYLDVLARESEVLADAAEAAGPDAPVPSCPGWTVTDLMAHCAGGDQWARVIVETGSREGASSDLAEDAPTGAALVPYFREGARQLVDVLRATDPTKSVWTFSPADRTAEFWRRRRAHETAMHRCDAQLAAGSPAPLDAELASDGIDELLVVFVPRFADKVAVDGETLHVHCIDVEGEWFIARAGDELKITREHAKGDVAARGTASDLLLYLRGRGPVDPLDVIGDAAVLERFRDAIKV